MKYACLESLDDIMSVSEKNKLAYTAGAQKDKKGGI